VTEKQLRHTLKPDARTEFCVVRKAYLEGTTFAVVLSKLLLYLVYNGYIRNRGSLRAIAPFALLILEGLVVNTAVRHDLKLVCQCLISEK